MIGKNVERVRALDGARGFAILLVFISHMDVHTFSSWMPPLLYQVLFISGAIGVAMLFVLSGFLMAFLYPQPSSAKNFLQKRYTRIVPLFLTVSIGLLLAKFVPESLGSQIVIVIFLAICVHLAWIYKIKKLPDQMKRRMFLGFVLVQLAVGVMYALVSQNIAVIDASEIAGIPYLLATGLVNSTLTFFAGDGRYPLLDTLYWSLGSEIIFYFLYPVVCAPVIAYLSPKGRFIKLIFLIALIVFFFGSSRMLIRVASFSILRPEYFFHFVGGMTLGYLYRKYGKNLSLMNTSVIRGVSVTGGGLLVLVFIVAHIPVLNSLYREILLTIPYTAILGTLLVPGTVIGRIFSSQFFVYMGTISYSLYLSHVWVRDIVFKVLKQPTTDMQTLLYIGIVFAVCVLVASALYVLVERPYFIRSSVKKITRVVVPYKVGNKGVLACVYMCVIYAGISTFAYGTNLTYEHLRDTHLGVATAYSHTKAEAAFLANESISVAAERKKTVVMLLPFLAVTLYLVYESGLLSVLAMNSVRRRRGINEGGRA